MTESTATDQLVKRLAKNKGISEEEARKLVERNKEKESDHGARALGFRDG